MKKLLTIISFGAILSTFLITSAASAMEVSFERDPSLPIVYLNVALRVGAVNDPADQSGLSNFMGEMLLRGTTSKTKEQIDTALDQMGASLGFETRAESLIMRGAVLSSQLDPFLSLVTEILTQPSFPENEIRKLKSEVDSDLLEELGHDPSLASRRFTRFLFNGHPYGNPILGTRKDVAALTRDEVAGFYDRAVRDRLMLVVATGDTDESKIRDWSNALAKARADTPTTLALTVVPAPQNAAHRRLLIIDKPDRTQTQINAGQIGVRMTDADYFPLYLGNYAFGGGSFSARLMVEIRVKRGWSYGANSSFRQGLQPRSWSLHLFPAAKDTPPALATTLAMVQDLKSKGLVEQEFQFSKDSLVNSAGFMYDTPKKRVENKLLERTLNLPDGFMKSYGPELSKVTLDQVNVALARFLKPDQLAIAVLGTAKSLKAPLAQAAGVPLEQVQVVPYTQE